MKELDHYIRDYTGQEDDIFTSLRGVKTGDLLPSGGPLDFFYDNIDNPSTTIFLKTKKKAKFFYADTDEFLSNILDVNPHWVLDIDKNILRLNLIYDINGSTVPLVFIFDIAKDNYRTVLKLLAKKGVFDLYFLSILYGGFVLEKRVKLNIPKSILKTFKSIK
ncbi:MAG TPA: hypothetical protein P5120_16560 [Spirochaetota bacterium]|nr:hypothetical protein [Spirochaetota bacterium]HPF05193.1 hypothetical protein [Spirochaetota bacterium]HPJ41893.1 hypothetical protein [Spirochaetota bacterium]HPR38238.1 hypothetical protein [Spirochaetota bacterium]HRX49134.1 hypothetical protein [Spirochaetota bacterium]